VSFVSIIVPCFNEQATIRMLLESIYSQTYPRQDMEVIIADGGSTDQTLKEVSDFQNHYPDLRVEVVNNPDRIIPAGLNRAIKAARGELIIRLDGHSMPDPDYVALCVDALEQGHGDNVGGVWEIKPRDQSWQSRTIATAAAHPLGVGDAHYRVSNRPQAVDTVPFGAFRKSVIDRIGYFDETLLTNEDYEFNTRLRLAGGVIWLDPKIRTVYFPPRSFTDLARQYWRYGYWKARMLKRYPGSIRWRQALPPAFVFSLVIFGFFGFWSPLARWLFLFQIVVYMLVLLLTAVHVWVKKRDMILLIGLPLAISIMHVTWGSAFLWSLLRR
jgi:succinoglycan biosynthesis protein ExoA